MTFIGLLTSCDCYHYFLKLSTLKQQKTIISEFWSSDVWSLLN